MYRAAGRSFSNVKERGNVSHSNLADLPVLSCVSPFFL